VGGREEEKKKKTYMVLIPEMLISLHPRATLPQEQALKI
jgi:hypothetical protein